ERPPRSDVSTLWPILTNPPGPLAVLANVSSVRGDCSATASASLWAPSGFEARFANPDRIAGAAAPTTLRASAASEMPATDAILETRSGVRNCDRADTILPFMVGFSLTTTLKLNNYQCTGKFSVMHRWARQVLAKS